MIVIDTQRNYRLVHTALVKTFRTCTAKILVNALTKNVYSTGYNSLQANTVQHLHYSGEMAATMD